MQLLEDRIRKDGKVREGNVLKVDSFLKKACYGSRYFDHIIDRELLYFSYL